MKPFILLFLFPFLLTAQDKSIIFTMRDHQVKQLILSSEDNVSYEYEDGLITTTAVIAGIPSQTFNYYSGDDRLDSVTTRYYYDEQGRDLKSEKMLFVDATKAEENEACLRIVSESEYDDTGLLVLTTVSTYEIKPNGREKKIPGKIRMKRSYTFYDNL